MGFEMANRTGEQFHNGFVDAENHAQNTTRNAGQYCSKSNQRPLQEPHDQAHDRLTANGRIFHREDILSLFFPDYQTLPGISYHYIIPVPF